MPLYRHCVKVIKAHDEWIRNAIPSPDGRLMLTCSNDHVSAWRNRPSDIYTKIVLDRTGSRRGIWGCQMRDAWARTCCRGRDLRANSVHPCRPGTCLRRMFSHCPYSPRHHQATETIMIAERCCPRHGQARPDGDYLCRHWLSRQDD
jgi:hypothetical protein